MKDLRLEIAFSAKLFYFTTFFLLRLDITALC